MITDYFDDKGIEYWTEGKNVSRGWVGLQCIYCDDHSNHLGVELSTGRTVCWLCGSHGKVVNLIMDLEECDYRKAITIVKQIWGDDPENVVGQTKLPPSLPAADRVVLPPIQSKWPGKYLSYLKSRGHSPKQLIAKYRLMPTHRFGSYGFRIIAPFFVGRKMVAYTGLDVTGKKEAKYKDSPIKDSVIPPFKCLYNIDKVKEGGRVVIVEGPTDVWRIGDGAVALGTNKINNFQLLQLAKKRISNAFVLLDADASHRAEGIANDIIYVIAAEVQIGELEQGDPDKMSSVDLIKVRKWLSS